MHNRKLMGVIRNNPVQTPLEHSECLIDRQGFERAHTIKVESNLGSKPAPKPGWRVNIDSKVDQFTVLAEWEVGIKLSNTAIDLRKT